MTFNGNSFDLPVLRYRALVNRVAAPGLSMRPYFNRYTEDAVDLCDVLSAFSSQGKAMALSCREQPTKKAPLQSAGPGCAI
jgi:predicted PolB exonuclease-like 3'-5' exonuclease